MRVSVPVFIFLVRLPWEACRPPLDGSGWMPQIHWRVFSASCTASVVQVRENVRGASLEGKALKTEQGLKVSPAAVLPCVGLYESRSCV